LLRSKAVRLQDVLRARKSETFVACITSAMLNQERSFIIPTGLMELDIHPDDCFLSLRKLFKKQQ